MNSMEYYRIWTDLWRWFRARNEDPDRFSEEWWKRIVAEAGLLAGKYPGLGKDLVLAIVGEFERMSRL